MAQYQSFPDAEGDSRTLEKLKALALPDLAGKSFLDVGCNEGFFCGFARFAGARRAIGLDKSQLFIDRARRRFPDCDFVLGDWNALPDGPFDVVLLASAIHYATDQPDLIRRLVELLSHDGVLVIEMGVVSSDKSEWCRVRRGDDERLFPSMKKIEEVLAPFAWKWLGPSVDQSGDPVKRHVIHVTRRRPVAYLLMQPPGYGKSTIAKDLFDPANVTRVSGDELILQIARKQRPAPDALHRVLAREFSPFQIDHSIRKVFDAGWGDALVKIFAESAQGGDFVLDMYVPGNCQPDVEKCLAGMGYLPVRMVWERAGLAPQNPDRLSKLVESYFESLVSRPLPAISAPAPRARGYVDAAQVASGHITLAGWAVDAGRQRTPTAIELRLDKRCYRSTVTAVPRRDVQTRLGLPHEHFGFRVAIDLPQGITLAELLQRAQVVAMWPDSEEVPLRYSTALVKACAEGRS